MVWQEYVLRVNARSELDFGGIWSGRFEAPSDWRVGWYRPTAEPYRRRH